jgi:crotonobetainyl-CoA:carnitine CoA-transferase CaiB-like acyl-CoA transferase
MLADLGADVIKIEPPEGDLTRYAHPRTNSLATYFVQQNIGKRAVSVDLKHAQAVELVAALADQADVVLENFRPGVMDRTGLGYAALSARNPRLVYASITGFGQTGPWRGRRAYAAVIQAESGFTRAQIEAHQRRDVVLPYVNDEHSHADLYTSLEATVAICAALVRRSVTGRGQHLDISMLETMLSVNEHVQDHLWDGPVPAGTVRSYQPGDYAILTVGDGTSVTISGHPADDGMFQNVASAMGRPQLAQEDPRFVDSPARLANLGALCDEMQAWASSFEDSAAIEAVFIQNGIAMGVLRTVREVATSPWARERQAVLGVTDRGDGEIRVPNSPFKFSDADVGVRGVPRYRGEDNREVLGRMLGLDDAELDRLEAEGVLTSRVPGRRR